MRISVDHRYSHGTDAVFSLFTDVAEIEAKQKALGARNIQVLDCDRDSGGATVRFVRELPAEVPGILSRFLQPWNSVEQSEEWQDCSGHRFECDLDIDVANVPVTVSGTLQLKPLDEGCLNKVRLTVECGIPFVGKTLAEFVAADCERLIALEYDYISERLDAA